jgi:N-acetylglucosamine-6-sulfatase
MMHDVLDAVDDDTIVVLTSDNGFHLGQHGLGSGKGAPYDSDVRVPLYVVGPGVKRGARDEMVSNIDLAATFEELAGLKPPTYRAGGSIANTFARPSRTQRNYTFFEHTWAPSLGMDPDKPYSGGPMDLIPSYVAVRSRTGLLVRLDLDNSWTGTRHAWEFYDYTETPWEKTNTYGARRHRAQVAELKAKLRQFDRCQEFTRSARLPKRCRNITR